ncbi:MAG: bile acid:sodium symporter family protein [Kiritimatiellae bacterium]|nr:bile acid:sodium symporter family protein [Kiritimatiellia bacterium]
MALSVLSAAAAGFIFPRAVSAAVPPSSVNWLLGAVMFGMGMSLRPGDFLLVLKRPRDVAIGAAAQFAAMPALAFAIAKAFALSPELAVGLVLVGACPGGTASNVISYLAKGDVALSVTMTSVSTLLAPLLTPLLVLAWGGASIDVPVAGMFISILQVVIAPIAAGLLLDMYAPRFAHAAKRFMPAFSALAVSAIVAGVVAANAANLKGNLGAVAGAVVLHNLCGMLLGWSIAAAFRMDGAKRRTVAVEVGMQNSGLAVSLAKGHFNPDPSSAAMPLSAVPGALFSVWHNLSGALFAAVSKAFLV